MRKLKLTPAEIERLAILAEECGEVVQAVGKVLRHGYESQWRDGPTNRQALNKELGDVLLMMLLCCRAGDVDDDVIVWHASQKIKKMKPFLHHQRELLRGLSDDVAVAALLKNAKAALQRH